MSGGNCYTCATSFGVFNKQLGCKNCGFAFCKKCLTKKTSVPKLGNEKAAVCNKCFDLLTGKAQPVSIDPPEALAKRLAAAPQAAKQQGQNVIPPTSKGQVKHLNKEDQELARRLEKLKEDRKSTAPVVPSQAEIENRVSKLKGDAQKNVPSEHEIAERLAVVRGQDPSKTTSQSSSILKPQARKTQQEQIDDLLSEICDEVEIDSRGANSSRTNDLNKEGMGFNVSQCTSYNISANAGDSASQDVNKESNLAEVNRLIREVSDELNVDAKKAVEDLKKDKELWERVQRLKEDRKSAAKANRNQATAGEKESSDDSEDEEKQTKNIIRQIMEENRLEEASSEVGVYSQAECSSQIAKKSNKSKISESRTAEPDNDSEEFPWCCICNNDAVLRCRGCDGDLYCKRCYREGHDREDFEDHQAVPYKKR